MRRLLFAPILTVGVFFALGAVLYGTCHTPLHWVFYLEISALTGALLTVLWHEWVHPDCKEHPGRGAPGSKDGSPPKI